MTIPLKSRNRKSVDASLLREGSSWFVAPTLSAWGVSRPSKHTTHRSSSGKKLYAVRDKKGKFKDIQTYARAHSQDVKRKAKSEKKT